MTDRWQVVLVVARVAVFVLAVATTAISYRAFKRSRSRYLRDATLGFGIITVGVFVEGVLYQLLNVSLTVVHIVESVAIALGFVLLLRSLLR
jgi:hypothetical protein